MEEKYILENKEAIEAIIETMVPVFKNNELLQKAAPIKSDQVVVVKKKEKLYRYGFPFTQEGEKYIYSNIQTLQNYLAKKYKLDRFVAEKEAADIMCLYILKVVFERNDFIFNSNYGQFRKKRETYTLLKGVSFIILVIVLALFYILRG